MAPAPNPSAAVLLLLISTGVASAQTAPAAPDRPLRSPDEHGLTLDARHYRDYRAAIDSSKTYTLAELIDFAESNNPQTRIAWENARVQAAALGIARAE